MHGVLPSRKTSHPPPYAARNSRMSSTRRRQLQLGAILACSALFIIFMISRLFGSSEERIPPGTPEVVVVTLIDDTAMSKEYIGKIQENRRYYASKQGMLPLLRPSPGPRRSKALIQTVDRIRDLLPQRHRLQIRRLPSQLGPRPRRPSRHDRLPTQHLLLRPLPSRPHHEPLNQPPIPHPGEEEARVIAAKGQASGSARQRHQDLRNPERRPCRSGPDAGWRGSVSRELHTQKRGLGEIFPRYLVRSAVQELQFPKSGGTCSGTPFIFSTTVNAKVKRATS